MDPTNQSAERSGSAGRHASRTDPRDASTVGTVGRVARLLACIAEAEGEVSLKYLCQALNLPASTVHRLLSLLIKEGLVERSTSSALYGPGLELARISSLIASKISIVNLAKPIMRTIVQECDQTCVLLRYIPTSRRVMAIHAEFSSNPLRYEIELFQPYSLLWGASGRAVLAFLPQEEIDAVLKDATVSPVSGEALPSRKVMLKQLREIQKQGYAITQAQRIAGAVGFAAPLFNSEPRVIGCLSLRIPKARFNQKTEATIAQLLRAQAAALNRRLGFDGRVGAV
jgi:DNA-binding IclR family transcriptional regulator